MNNITLLLLLILVININHSVTFKIQSGIQNVLIVFTSAVLVFNRLRSIRITTDDSRPTDRIFKHGFIQMIVLLIVKTFLPITLQIRQPLRLSNVSTNMCP
jgi:uncharacterized membrane protein